MKTLLLSTLLVILSFSAFAIKNFAPNSSSSITGSGSYCQGASASSLVYTYNTCNSGVGGSVGVAVTITWYQSTTNATSGGTAVSSTSGTCSVSGTGTVSYTPSTSSAGISYYYCTITWSGAGTCRGTGTLTSASAQRVEVIGAPGSISGSTTLCEGVNATLSNAALGGTWSTSNASVASVNATTGAVTSVASGSATITYSTGCGSDATAAVTVNPSPAAITGATTVCTGNTITLSNAVSGGSWSSSNAAVASVDPSGIVSGVTAGSVAISYAIGSCRTTSAITVNSTPSPAISGSSFVVCQGAVITLGGSPAGGSWSTAAADIASVETSGDVTGVAAGTATISYSATNSCGTTAATQAITVNPLPLVDTISGTTNVCPGATTTLADTTVGGVWTCDNTSVATIDASGVVTGIVPGTADIYYTLTTSCGTDYGVTVITVNDVPFADTVSGIATMCTGTTTTLTDATSGGTWSSSDASLATVDAAGVVTALGAGSPVISYAVTSSCGTTYATKTLNITGTPGSLPAITGTNSACIGSSSTLANTVSGGTWSTSNSTIASVSVAGDVTAVSAGTANITYTVSNSCGSTYVVSDFSAVTAPSAPASITGSASVCAYATITLSNATSGGSWSSSDITLASVDATTGVVSGVAPGSPVISYTISNACGSASATRTITVNNGPAPISGSSIVCTAVNTTLTDAVSGGTWTRVNGTGTATVGATTGIVNGSAAGTITISYTIGSCRQTLAMTVSPSPAAITGTNTVCEGATRTYANTVAGGTWSSSNTSIATVDAATGVITGVAAGAATITYAIGGCFSIRGITVNVSPAAISGATSVCTGTTTTLTNSISGGTWTRTNGTGTASIGSATGVVTGSTAGNVTISYTISGCRATMAMTVNQSPAAITGTNTVCEGATRVYADTRAGGTWSSSNTSIATVHASNGTITGITAGAGVITYAIGTCYATRGITVNVSPAAISGATSVCTGTTTTLTNSVSGGTWTRTNGTGTATIGATTGVVTGSAAGAVTISYTISGCRSTMAMTVNQSPAAITGTNTVCEGATRVYADTRAGGTWSSSNTSIATVDAGDGTITGITAGAGVITYAIGSCYATRGITVNVSPAAISGATTVCRSATTTLTNSVAGGTWSRTNGTGTATIGSTTGVVTGGTTAGTVTISYTVGSCRTTQGMTVIGIPAAISGASALCNGSSITLTNATVGGSWSSNNSSVASVEPSTGIVTGLTNGTAVIAYSTGCGADATRTETVNSSPAAITGGSVVCETATLTLADSVSGGAWTSSNTSVATVNPSTGVVTGVTAGSATITYAIGSCFVTTTITVNPLPLVSGITGTATLCEGATTSLSDTTASGIWSSSNASVAVVDASGVVSGVSGGSATISYTVTNACGSVSVTDAVTVNALPTGAVASAGAPCYGYSTNVLFTGTPGAAITYSIDSGSAVSATLTGGTFTLGTGALAAAHTYTFIDATAAGCYSAIGNTITVTPIQMQWVGGTSGHETDWNTASNWACGTVPSSTDDIVIAPGAYTLTIPSGVTAQANNLTIQSGAAVNLATTAYFDVKGTFTNNGNVIGAGTLRLNNTSAQSISGMGNVNNIELDNNAGATIASASRLTIKGALTVTNGNLATSDSLVIGSDSLSTGRVAPITASGASITGNVKVMQYIPGGYRRYRFWSHPFSNYIGLSQIGNYIDVTGAGGATNGFTTTGTNSASAIRYNPLVSNATAASDPGWRPFTSAYTTADSNRLHQYQGIRLMIRGAKGEGLDGAAYTPSAATIGMVGNLNQGSQRVVLAKGSSANQDYNMVGNPYASPVDIGTIIYNAKNAGNIAGTAFYVFNPFLGAGGQFMAIPINGTPYYLQANCAFQVRAAHNGDTLNFTENNKGNSATTNLLRTSQDDVSLYIYDANNHPWDMLHVKFNNEASDKEDTKFDAGKPAGMDFNFYSLSADNQRLAIDARPFSAEKVIPLGINSSFEQEYTIKAEGVVVPEGGKLYLHDKLLKQTILLEQGTAYKFTVSADKTTQGDNRFELKMVPAETAVAATAKGLQVTLSPNPATDKVAINFSNGSAQKVSVRIIDITGISIYNNDLGMQTNGVVNVALSNLSTGIYMVELTAGDQKIVKRLIKE